jgi:short subunit dehydrogenase-like uncharacterized protein
MKCSAHVSGGTVRRPLPLYRHLPVSDRDLDVVVFGATGVTGRSVAAHLAERSAEMPLRWAAAARDTSKAARILGEAGVGPTETIVADIADRSSLTAMAARARVVLNLVGPYTFYGRPVIEACVASGAHYADLTGEMPFVRRMIDDFDGPAAAAGIKVVQTCGFESLPADLLVMLASDTARARWDETLATVDLAVTVTPPPGVPRPSDGISGGTMQSMLAVTGDEDAALIADPAALIADATAASAVRSASPITIAPRRGSNGAVIAPMAPAAFINPAVIQRTARLLASAEGRPLQPFRYREGVVLGGSSVSLPLRWGIAGALSVTQAGFRSIAAARPAIRRPIASALSRIVPASGFGPAGERLERWTWQMSVQARTTAGREVGATVQADGHPGYLATARMLAEAGLLLAEDGATPARTGCLTPGVALGSGCIERLARAHMHFSVSP